MDRIELQFLLETILGSRNVYFQPPESVKIEYPAIVYSLSRINTVAANDDKYAKFKQYLVTLIDEDPDSEIVEKLLDLKHCTFNKSFSSDNLNHFNFTLFY